MVVASAVLQVNPLQLYAHPSQCGPSQASGSVTIAECITCTHNVIVLIDRDGMIPPLYMYGQLSSWLDGTYAGVCCEQTTHVRDMRGGRQCFIHLQLSGAQA